MSKCKISKAPYGFTHPIKTTITKGNTLGCLYLFVQPIEDGENIQEICLKTILAILFSGASCEVITHVSSYS